MASRLAIIYVLFFVLQENERLRRDAESDAALEEERQKQAYEAKYDFGSKVDDQINDGQLEREEHRENGKTVGHYGYSDGFVRRTVHYEADENGYRVTKETQENIGEGPQFNDQGIADVQTSLAGQYQIKLDSSDNEKHYKDVNAA
ncbi:hypothetical protein ACFFRR_008227 [Megaselia abdita]